MLLEFVRLPFVLLSSKGWFMNTLRRIVLPAMLVSIALLGGCVLTDDFPKKDNDVVIEDPQAIVQQQAAGAWVALASNEAVPDAGFVAFLDISAGNQTLDLGFGELAGGWTVDADGVLSLQYGSTQDAIALEPTIRDGKLMQLVAHLDIDEDGSDDTLVFEPNVEPVMTPADLYGEWNSLSVQAGEKLLATRFSEDESAYGFHGTMGFRKVIVGRLQMFPCGGQTCWAIVDATFGEDAGASNQGKDAPNVGGVVRMENNTLDKIYLPVINDAGVIDQVLARHQPL